MKTSELTGAALDWAVASAEGYSGWDGDCFTLYQDGYPGGFFIEDFHPSTNWAQGGPIIERERITVIAMPNGTWATSTPMHSFHHPTPLIAAMRCYVASKLGDKLELPEGLQ